MGERRLGVLHSNSSRCLHENMKLSWWGMEDAHLKIPKHFLLDGCMHLSYQILRIFCVVDIYACFECNSSCFVSKWMSSEQIMCANGQWLVQDRVRCGGSGNDSGMLIFRWKGGFVKLMFAASSFSSSNANLADKPSREEVTSCRSVVSIGYKWLGLRPIEFHVEKGTGPSASWCRWKEVQSDDCKVAQPKCSRLGHFVFGK